MMNLPNEIAAEVCQPQAAPIPKPCTAILTEQTATVKQFAFPDPSCVKGRVLADLLRGDKLTHMDVWERHGSSRASHHILRLRQAGWPVITTEIDAPTSDGRIARIALYSLPVDTIQAAGEAGQFFAEECAQIIAERMAA